MGFKILIDDFDISTLVTITNVNRGGTPERVYRRTNFPNGNGGRLNDGRFEMRTMSIEFRVLGDIESKKDQLLKVLPIYQKKKIVFGDQTDRYYEAQLVGSLNFEKKNGKSAIGSFELVAEDPIAYSVHTKQAKRVRNVLTYVNNGTADAYPTFTFTPQSDLKMFALVHPNGNSLQIGSEASSTVFPSGKRVVINTYSRQVLVGGVEVQVNHASRWFSLSQNATTELIYTVNRDSTLPTVDSYYRDGWL